MENEKIEVLGIEDKKKLFGFFAAKGHNNLVLRVADLKELPLPGQHQIARILSIYGGYGKADGDEPSAFFMRNSLDGYLIIPFEKLFEAEMTVLVTLQNLLYMYRDARRSKGEPSRVDVCKCGRAKGCSACDGVGHTITLLEMSDEEIALAGMRR